jgi:hypothetical protein
MNAELEQLGRANFQCMPLSSNNIPNHIKIDTASLVNLMIEDKNKYLSDIKANKKKIWGMFFDIEKKIFKEHGQYVFNDSIVTDGYGVSVCQIRKDRYNIYTKQTIPTEKYEVPYLDEQTEETLEEIKLNPNIGFDDPGKKNIHYIIGKKKNKQKRPPKIRYSSRQRIRETERFKHINFTNNYKNRKVGNKTIKELEEKLGKNSSKTVNIEKYKEYIKTKLEIYEMTKHIYAEASLRKWKVRAKINKQRSESKFINNIKKTLEIDPKERINIIIGNWGVTKQMRGFVSTPGIGLIKRIERQYKIKFWKVYEGRTSKIDYKTGEELTNKEVVIKGKKVSLHSVLVRKQKKKNGQEYEEYIHRDYIGSNGIREIGEQYLIDRRRPEKYTHVSQPQDKGTIRLASDVFTLAIKQENVTKDEVKKVPIKLVKEKIV